MHILQALAISLTNDLQQVSLFLCITIALPIEFLPYIPIRGLCSSKSKCFGRIMASIDVFLVS